jgi:hypothetical protein
MRQHSDHSPKGRNFDVYPRMDPDLFEEDLDGVDEEVLRLCEEMRELDDA